MLIKTQILKNSFSDFHAKNNSNISSTEKKHIILHWTKWLDCYDFLHHIIKNLKMTQKALKLKAEVEIHSVSCPGVFFPCKGPVSIQYLILQL